MQADYLSEPDQLLDVDLPFTHCDFEGHDKQQNTLISALIGHNHHHAYLLAGPRGIGKATLAHKCARILLREGAARQNDAQDDIFSMINAGAHPNFFALCRAINPKTKKYSQNILVDQVRAMSAWLHSTAGMRGFRVVLVDPLEAFNISASNALLKMLEEPPKMTLFLLISHAPGQLLPTLKSRCVRLDFNPLPPEHIHTIINQRLPDAGLDDTQQNMILHKSHGNARFALALAGTQQDGTLMALMDGLAQLHQSPIAQNHKLAQALGAANQSQHFTTYFEIISNHLAQLGTRNPLAAEMWAKLHASYHQTQTYNLDRKQFFIQAIDWCQKAAKQAA